MEIKTLNAGIVNTDKMADKKAELFELLEKSGIIKFCKSNDGAAFQWAYIQGHGAVSNFDIPNGKALDMLLGAVNEMVLGITDKNFRIQVVQVEKIYLQINF